MKHLHIMNIVREILEENPKARESDNILFAEVLSRRPTSLSPEIERAVIKAFFDGVGGINYDSVRRSRQKLQQLNPELQPSESVQERRKAREAEIKDELRNYGKF